MQAVPPEWRKAARELGARDRLEGNGCDPMRALPLIENEFGPYIQGHQMRILRIEYEEGYGE